MAGLGLVVIRPKDLLWRRLSAFGSRRGITTLGRPGIPRHVNPIGTIFIRLPAPPGQKRLQSTHDGKQETPNNQPPPKLPPRSILLRVLAGSVRNLGNVFKPRSLRLLLRSNPEELVLALVLLAIIAGIGVYVVRLYFTYFNAEQFTKYPAPVAKSLRRALYYSNYSPDNRLALKYWKMALEQCDELGLDSFSDDVLGIKIQLAAWLEKIGNYDNAIQVLERVLGDCIKWVEVMEKSTKDGKVPKSLMPPPPIAGPEVPSRQGAIEVETIWGKRTRVLAKAVAISVKLGELYADEHVLQQEAAHAKLTWAVETALRELQRRTSQAPRDGEGPWMSPEEMGGALESLAHSYEKKSQFNLALPLFFQALRLSRDPCHSAVIMNNLAVTFAQHPLLVPVENLLDQPSASPEPVAASPRAAPPKPTRASYLDAARRWATNAQQHAAEPQGEQRTAECDEACAVSLCNLGDIARLSGDLAEARRRFEQAVLLSQETGYAPALVRAQENLRSLGPSSRD